MIKSKRLRKQAFNRSMIRCESPQDFVAVEPLARSGVDFGRRLLVDLEAGKFVPFIPVTDLAGKRCKILCLT